MTLAEGFQMDEANLPEVEFDSRGFILLVNDDSQRWREETPKKDRSFKVVSCSNLCQIVALAIPSNLTDSRYVAGHRRVQYPTFDTRKGLLK